MIRVAPPKKEIEPSDISDTSSSKPTVTVLPHKTYSSVLPGKKLKVSEYKAWLQSEMYKISGASADDEIEITN